MASYFVLICILFLVRLCYIEVIYGSYLGSFARTYDPVYNRLDYSFPYSELLPKVLLPMREACTPEGNSLVVTWTLCKKLEWMWHASCQMLWEWALCLHVLLPLPLDWKPGERQGPRRVALWRSCSWEEQRLSHNEQTKWVRSNFLLLWDTDGSLMPFVSLA